MLSVGSVQERANYIKNLSMMARGRCDGGTRNGWRNSLKVPPQLKIYLLTSLRQFIIEIVELSSVQSTYLLLFAHKKMSKLSSVCGRELPAWLVAYSAAICRFLGSFEISSSDICVDFQCSAYKRKEIFIP